MKSADYLRLILAELVSFPEKIEITESLDHMGKLLSVRCAPADMGKVIGREGKTAKAVQHILNCQGFSQAEKVSVKFIDPTPQPL